MCAFLPIPFLKVRNVVIYGLIDYSFLIQATPIWPCWGSDLRKSRQLVCNLSLKSTILPNFAGFRLTFEPKMVDSKYIKLLHSNFEAHFRHFVSNLRLNSRMKLLIKNLLQTHYEKHINCKYTFLQETSLHSTCSVPPKQWRNFWGADVTSC